MWYLIVSIHDPCCLHGHKNGPMKGLGIFDKILIFILVKEIVLYKGKSSLEAQLIL